MKIANHDHEKYINTQEFSFAARLKEAKLATKDDFDDFVKKINFDKKLQRNKKKLLQIKQNMQRLKKI